MCVLGIIGPALNHNALRDIGIIGYAIVWPIVCIPLSRAFRQAGLPSGAIVPAPGPDAGHLSQLGRPDLCCSCVGVMEPSPQHLSTASASAAACG